MSSGAMCPLCGVYTCKHRSNCNFCGEYSQWVDRYGIKVNHPNTGRPMIHDLWGYPHKCREGKKGGDFIKDKIQYKWPYPVEIDKGIIEDQHEYMRRHAKLEGKDWILYVDDKRTGFVIDREQEVNV